jgi:hypothetical protein
MTEQPIETIQRNSHINFHDSDMRKESFLHDVIYKM